jgi:hypothetical protein
MSTKRITRDEMAEAYRKTGLGIAREDYISDDGSCGCGMGVYAVAFLGVDPRGDAIEVFMRVDDAIEAAGFSTPYQNGFSTAFDGGSRNEHDLNPDYALGYEDGKAAYDAAMEVVHVD